MAAPQAVKWSLEADVELLSFIHITQDGVGGANDKSNLIWREISQAVKAEMAARKVFYDFSPNECRRRWEFSLREVLRVELNGFETNPWTTTEDDLLRSYIDWGSLGGRRTQQPPLTWHQIANAMNKAGNIAKRVYTYRVVTSYYYFHLAPRLAVCRREAGPNMDLMPRTQVYNPENL